ncbi:MAG TPA: mandelate racemase/muconate lactonizing enzyme family protein [Amycolatopsis sp.]|nr:mandelate racemase/muconate lactonizing enzyme family protein [Amycolatopsis sp.]
MKITDVRTHVLVQELDRPFGMSQWYWGSRASCLVEVSTDEGITGWGECYGPAAANAAVITELFRPALLGRDPGERAVLWQQLYNRTRDYGRKGIPVCALSGVDIALWDIAGRAVDQPVYRLLGGPFATELSCYASAFYYPTEDEPADVIEREAARLVARGFRAAKMKVGGESIADDVERVRRVRAALGPDVALAVDANRAYTPAQAIDFGERVTPYDILWFEEPVEPEDIAGYQEVRAALRIPIAGGESEYTSYGFRDFIGNRCVDIAQPDLTGCGGISEGLRIAAITNAAQVSCFPHVWGSAVAVAAALHFVAALPDPVPSRAAQRPLVELDQAPNVLRERLADLTTGPVVTVPDGPGLGITIDREVLAAFTVTT